MSAHIRTPRQRDEDRQACERFRESEFYPLFVRSMRERQYLQMLTLASSPAISPEDAFVLVHRQQALIMDAEQFLADPLEWLLPPVPDEEPEDSRE